MAIFSGKRICMLKPMVKQGLTVLHSSVKTEKELIMRICVHLQVSHCTETAWIVGCLKMTVNVLMCFVGCSCTVVFA